jgi:hypothetical protein
MHPKDTLHVSSSTEFQRNSKEIATRELASSNFRDARPHKTVYSVNSFLLK